MNALLRKIEADRLREHEERMTTLRGAELPTDAKARAGCSFDTHSLRAAEAEVRRKERAAKLQAVSLVMDSGRPVAELCMELGLTERQYFQAKALLKKRQSSRGVVTP